jgi:hypothetical protein
MPTSFESDIYQACFAPPRRTIRISIAHQVGVALKEVPTRAEAR